MATCPSTCDAVFIATEEDKLYTFDAHSSAQFWVTDLAANAGGEYAYCPLGSTMPTCENDGVIKPNIGVTGTPVIDRAGGVLYVVSLVLIDSFPGGEVEYFLHAINYLNGHEMPGSPYLINPTGVTGEASTSNCVTTTGNGPITFAAADHLQRAALLLLSNYNGEPSLDEIYIAFAPADKEEENGWLLSYTFNLSAGSFVTPAPTSILNTTPHGTGGGIWMDGAGLAADGTSVSGTYLYVSVANGTFDYETTQNPSNDYGDSLLKLPASTLAAPTVAADYFTPADVFTYQPGTKVGRCLNDDDLGSGGVMLFPDSFITGLPHLMLSADKESKLYVVNRDNLTGYNSAGDQIVQELQTPLQPNGSIESGQGYWGSPAYLEWVNGGVTTRAIYYSVDATSADAPTYTNFPLPLNMYVLSTSVSPPIPSSPTYSTATVFCGHGGAPAASSNGSTQNTGIVWAIEDSNVGNPANCKPGLNGVNFKNAILHAYNARNLQDLYDSPQSAAGLPRAFTTPMIFKGAVYMGTQTEVDVFGLCTVQQPCID